MPIAIKLDVMLATRKMKSKDLAQMIGITEQNLSLHHVAVSCFPAAT